MCYLKLIKYNTTYKDQLIVQYLKFSDRACFIRPVLTDLESESEKSADFDEENDFLVNLNIKTDDSTSQDPIFESRSTIEENKCYNIVVGGNCKTKYTFKTIKDADLHYHSISFNPGNVVLL